MLKLSGWIWKPGCELRSLRLRTGQNDFPVAQHSLPSPDVASAVNEKAKHARFSGQWLTSVPATTLVDSRLVARFTDGSEFTIDKLGSRGLANDSGMGLTAEFTETLARTASGSMLEIGSRARSGITRRHFIRNEWQYTGMDILAGKNVDVVGDAHQLSNLFPRESFDAVMSFSVLEHLLMPWKFVIELNRVLRTGAIGLFATHQSWPVHDQPWDFWRFSSDAWAALLNRATGFEIIEARMGERGFVVANSCHAATNFANQPDAFLSSTVMFRKIGGTALEWNVDVASVLTNSYPTHTTSMRT